MKVSFVTDHDPKKQEAASILFKAFKVDAEIVTIDGESICYNATVDDASYPEMMKTAVTAGIQVYESR